MGNILLDIYERLRFGGVNPTRDWVRNPALSLRFDLENHTFDDVGIGSPSGDLHPFGKPSTDTASIRDGYYAYSDLGLEFWHDGDEVHGISFFFSQDLHVELTFIYNDQRLRITHTWREEDVLELFGEPLWEDREEAWDNLDLTYLRHPGVEWDFVFVEGRLEEFSITRLDDEDYAEYLADEEEEEDDAKQESEAQEEDDSVW